MDRCPFTDLTFCISPKGCPDYFICTLPGMGERTKETKMQTSDCKEEKNHG